MSIPAEFLGEALGELTGGAAEEAGAAVEGAVGAGGATEELVSTEVEGLEDAKERTDQAQESSMDELRRFVARAIGELHAETLRLASLSDHTTADLAKLGHPYARRFGADNLHPDYMIHVQEGTLVAGITGPEVRDTGDNVEGSYRSTAWYTPFLELGTVLMRPRPFLHQTVENLREGLMSAARHIGASIEAAVTSGRKAA